MNQSDGDIMKQREIMGRLRCSAAEYAALRHRAIDEDVTVSILIRRALEKTYSDIIKPIDGDSVTATKPV